MRLIYLDEAGVSNLSQEPILTVAGVILDADQDFKRLENHLRSLSRKYLPEEDRENIIFHAHEIWHGSGFWRRDEWPRSTRISVLQELATMPAKFHLPIAVGFVHRESVRARILENHPSVKSENLDLLVHAHAFMLAVQDVDLWMRYNARNEVGMLVAENTGKVQKLMKLIHEGYRDTEEFADPETTLVAPQLIDTVHFAAKNECPMLQLADMVAFLVKREIQGKTDTHDLFSMLSPQLICRTQDGAPGQKKSKSFYVKVPISSVELIE